MTASWADHVSAQLAAIRAAGQWRATRAFDAHGPAGVLDGRPIVSFASNDYLGLSAHPAVATAAHAAVDRWGTSSTAARLIVGTRPCHHDLEDALAEWKGTERAVVYPTGYAANLGVLSALGGPDVTVFSDELNHASIIDGCRLSRSEVVVYRHDDVDQLAGLLARAPGRAIVVTDAVFSMDGDAAPVADLAALCAATGALLVLDEAHAVLGPPVAPVDGLELVRVGTLSKTLGALGGFATASAPIADLLVNRSRPYIFTTAPSPADAAAALASLHVLRGADGERLVARLRAVVDRVAPGHPSPIVPIVLGEERRAVEASVELAARGLLVPAIRPPTVPPGTSRLRIAMSAAHTDEMVDHLLAELAALGLR